MPPFTALHCLWGNQGILSSLAICRQLSKSSNAEWGVVLSFVTWVIKPIEGIMTLKDQEYTKKSQNDQQK